MKPLLLVLLLALTACGPRFLKPGATRPEFERDYEACFAKAAPPIGVTVASLFFTPAAAYVQQKTQGRTNRCMQDLGYDVSRGNGGFR